MKQMESRIKRGVLFVPIFIGGFFLFTWVIMLLWNGILPEVTGVKNISFFQAMGILVLSKILFGGFGGGWRGGRYQRGKWVEMKEKFTAMTPEEREKFKVEWKNRCGGKWGRFEKTETPSASPEHKTMEMGDTDTSKF